MVVKGTKWEGREVDELKWVEGVMRSPEYSSPTIFTQKLWGESWGAIVLISQMPQRSGFIDLDEWIFFNLINPDNWYGGGSLTTSYTHPTGRTLQEVVRRVSVVSLKPWVLFAGGLEILPSLLRQSLLLWDRPSGIISSCKLQHWFPAKPKYPGPVTSYPLSMEIHFTALITCLPKRWVRRVEIQCLDCWMPRSFFPPREVRLPCNWICVLLHLIVEEPAVRTPNKEALARKETQLH